MKRIFRQTLMLLAAAFLCTATMNVATLATGANEAEAQVKAKKVKATKTNQRPSLSYRPQPVSETVKYAERIGILTMRDQRVMKFYGGSDGYFVEPVTKAINEALFYEFKTGQLFTKVVNIRVYPGKQLSPADRAARAEPYDVRLLVTAEIAVFLTPRAQVVTTKAGCAQ